MVVKAAEKLNIRDKVRTNGTYCFVSGPAYESRAECRFLRMIGGDSVGMSTVPEVVAAKHCGMKILGLSLITNKVVVNPGESNHANHEEVLQAVEASGKFVEGIVKEITQKDILGQYLDKLPAFEYKPNPKAVQHVEAESSGCKNCNCKCKCCPPNDHLFVALGVAAIVGGLFYLLKAKGSH